MIDAFGNNETVHTRTADAVTGRWLFMSGPLPITLVVAIYLFIVLKIGPRLMATRKPFSLTNVLQIYNLYQVMFSTWHCYTIISEGLFYYTVTKGCHPVDPNSSMYVAFLDGAWWYFFSKVIELLDTVFFVMRKKQSQVTFLHVYHHGLTAISSWAYLKYFPGEQGIVIGFLNSFTHIVMYSYYFLAACGPQFQKYLWWKRYITWIQLVQFCLMLTYLSTITVYGCKLQRSVTIFFTLQASVFLILFTHFYLKAYKNKRPQPNPQKILEKLE